jgi:hypothetical protein
MSRGGFRVGAGRPKGSRDLPLAKGMPTRESGEMPLDYCLRIMRDPNIDPARRDRMAQVALPYCHRVIKTRDNKKEEAAEKAELLYNKFYVQPEPTRDAISEYRASPSVDIKV